MQLKKAQRHYQVVLTFPNNMTRTVSVKASGRETAERRAMKRNPTATGVQRG